MKIILVSQAPLLVLWKKMVSFQTGTMLKKNDLDEEISEEANY